MKDPKTGQPPPFHPHEILVSCALEAELTILRRHVEGAHRMLVSGLGIENAGRGILQGLQKDAPGALVFTGTSGRIDSSVAVGEVIFPAQWCLEDGSCYQQSALLVNYLKGFGYRPRGSGVSVHRPVVTRRHRDRLSAKNSPLVCDMESAAVLRAASQAGVPAIALKVVSDKAESNIPEYHRDFEANMVRLAQHVQKLLNVLTDRASPEGGDPGTCSRCLY